MRHRTDRARSVGVEFIDEQREAPMLSDLKLEAEGVLNMLLKEGLIPFGLNVGALERVGTSIYTIRFFDSRIRSVEFYCSATRSFKDACRTAILERVAKMSGPLAPKPKL